MSKTNKGWLAGLLTLMSACTVSIPEPDRPAPCSAEWLEFVEQELRTSDPEGHGPDIGSDEWRSAIEFKLGIRDQAGTPDSDTTEWCIFIDRHIARHTTHWQTGRLAQAPRSRPAR